MTLRRFAFAGLIGLACAGVLAVSCTPKEDPDIAVASVSLNKMELTLDEGQSSTLTATVKPDNATNKAVEWSSDKPEIATVDASGIVTAVKAGSATVTVKTKDGGKTATCKVTVNAKVIAVTGVTINPETLTLEEGAIQSLTATVTPENATDKAVEWKSSAADIATVDSNGKVTAVKAGSADITVTTKDGGKTATCKVTVNAKAIAVTGVTVSPETLSLIEGASRTLTATVAPDNATDKSVEWKSSKTDVATVDANGKVTAVKAGTANITVTTKDGGKTATCKVTVTAKDIPVTGVSWKQTLNEMAIHDEKLFEVTYTPSNATNVTYSWKSSNESVAEITVSYGKMAYIRATGVGTATITATVGDKSVSQLVTVFSPVYSVSITAKNSTDEYYIQNHQLHLTVEDTYTLEAHVSALNSSHMSMKWKSEYPSNVKIQSESKVSDGVYKATLKALSPRLSGSTVLPIRIYATSYSDPNVMDYIEVYVYSKPTSITCTSMSDPDMLYVKPGYTKTLSFTVEPATARQSIFVETIPSTYGTWSCSVSGLKATVGCPNAPSNNRDAFYNSDHSFMFFAGGKYSWHPTVQVNMHPCDLYASDIKPMDYLYYNVSTGKFRSSDGGLRSYRYGTTQKIAVSPSKQSNETIVGVITYLGSVNDNLASSNGILTGLSNSSGTHGFAISLGYASTSTKWSDDKDDVDAASNWPSAVGSLFVSGDLFYNTWQNGWSLTQGGVLYNSKVGNSHKIKPVTLVVNYESSFPTSKITAATHWLVPTFSMGRIGMSNDDKSLVYHLSGSDNNRLQFLNQNITAAGGTPYNAKCWSINTRSKSWAYLVHGFNGMANSLLYPEKTETYAVRLWMVF